MSTLCVVDMQSKFQPATYQIADAVLKQIKLAKKRRSGILFVELGTGATIERLTSATIGYKRVASVKKRGSDGSKKFVNSAKINKFDLKEIRVC